MKQQLAIICLTLLLANGCITPENGAIGNAAKTSSIQRDVAERIDRFIADEMEKRHIAGAAVAVVSNGQIRYAEAAV